MKFAARLQGAAHGTAAIGVGDHALRMSRKMAGARARLTEKALHKADTELAELAQATGTGLFEAWSGPPVPLRLVCHAREFLRLLPVSAPVPRAVADDQGLLSFEWTGSNARRLVVMVSEDGMLVYSGRLGPRRRISGAEPLSDELPHTIRQSLRDVIG